MNELYKIVGTQKVELKKFLTQDSKKALTRDSIKDSHLKVFLTEKPFRFHV